MLAKQARVSLSTVRDFERKHRQPLPNNVAAMRRALEEMGIRFEFDSDGKPAGISGGNASRPPGSYWLSLSQCPNQAYTVAGVDPDSVHATSYNEQEAP